MSKILYEKKERIAYITLNRPPLNVIDLEMVRNLHDIWDDFRDDDNRWVAILSGAGTNFSAGFDIKDFLQMVERKFEWKDSVMFGDEGCSSGTHSVWKPVVGALDGVVNGTGLWLSLECDIRIATKQASFALGELKLNVPVEFSGLLTRYMPQAIANEMLFTGNRITAERAYNFGLINKVVPREQLMSEAISIADTLCECSPMAIRAMKQLVYQGQDLDRHSVLALSESTFMPVVNSEDTREGFQAFLEKRKPIWKSQ